MKTVFMHGCGILSAAVVGFACGNTTPESTGCPMGVLVAVTDYSSSAIGVLPLVDSQQPALLSGNELGADPALSTSRGRHFFVERDAEQNIFELDPCGHAIRTYATRDPSEAYVDPMDVAVASDGSLWIARFASSSALVITSDRVTIDLASADADGDPNMSAVEIAQTVSGEKAFFALGRLDDLDPNLSSRQPSAIAVVDVATRALEQVVPLAGRNPFGRISRVGTTLWLAGAGNVDDASETDAGIVSFSMDTRTSSLLIAEPAIGGSVDALAIDDHCGAAIAFDAVPYANHTFLVSFDVDGSLVESHAFGPTTGFDLAGLVWIDGTLLVGDRRLTASGYLVHTFRRDDHCVLTQGPDLAPLELAPLAFAR